MGEINQPLDDEDNYLQSDPEKAPIHGNNRNTKTTKSLQN